jgi:hypothetical protein
MVPSTKGGGDGDRHDDDDGDRKKCNKRHRSSAQELSQSSLKPCTNKYDPTTTFHHHRLLTKVARESTVPSTKSIVIVPRHQYPRADFINDAANATERETEVEILSAEQQQQRSQFWTKQLSQRQIIYNIDQLPTVRSRFTVPQLSHYPCTEGRRGEDLFNTTTTAHFNNNNNNNNNATIFTTATKVDPFPHPAQAMQHPQIAQQQEAQQQPQSRSQQTLNGGWQSDKDVDDRRKMIAMM